MTARKKSERPPAPMPEAEFWNVIESVRRETGSRMGEPDAFSRQLAERLAPLSPGELLAFDWTMSDLEARAYRYDLWGAAYVINGGCSDDGFLYFRRWLIAQGRKFWEAALDDPESLAKTTLAGEEAEFEELAYVARSVFEEKAGREPTPKELEPSRTGLPRKRPAGKDWQEEDLDERFPKLTAKFG